MKTHTTILVALTACLALAACHRNGTTPQLRSAQDTLSWAMGENLALSLQQMSSLNLDYQLVAEAMERMLDGHGRVLDDSTMQVAMTQIIGAQQMAAMQQSNAMEAEANRQQEEYFARLVAEHPQVQKHPSGFYYEVLQAGKGRKANYADRISFDYRSFVMLTGQPWDQTYGKRPPITHTVGKPMFQGLVEGMQLMQAGSIFRFYFPYQMAFGTQGSGDIPPCTPFIYEVELHQIFDD